MTRCRHNRGEIIEVVSATSTHYVNEGNVDQEEYPSEHDCMGFFFHCADCGMKIKYHSVKSPLWLKDLMKQIGVG